MDETAAKAAFMAAQSVYRADHDHFPLRASWETTTEQVREGWRQIANAAVAVAEYDELAIARTIAPYLGEDYNSHDIANAVVRYLRRQAALRGRKG